MRSWRRPVCAVLVLALVAGACGVLDGGGERADSPLPDAILDALSVEEDGAVLEAWIWPSAIDSASPADGAPPEPVEITDRSFRDMDDFVAQYRAGDGVIDFPPDGSIAFTVEVLDTADELDLVSVALHENDRLAEVWVMDLDGTLVTASRAGEAWEATVHRVQDDGTIAVGYLGSASPPPSAGDGESAHRIPGRGLDLTLAATSTHSATAMPPALQDIDDAVGWYCGPNLGSSLLGVDLLDAALADLQTNLDTFIAEFDAWLDAILEFYGYVDAIAGLASAIDNAAGPGPLQNEVKRFLARFANFGYNANEARPAILGAEPVELGSAAGELLDLLVDVATADIAFGRAAVAGLITRFLLAVQVILVAVPIVIDASRLGLDHLRGVSERIGSVRTALPSLSRGVNGFTDARLVLASVHADTLRGIWLARLSTPAEFSRPGSRDPIANFDECPGNTPASLAEVSTAPVVAIGEPIPDLPDEVEVEMVSGCPDHPCRLQVSEPAGRTLELVLGEPTSMPVPRRDDVCNGSGEGEEIWQLRRAPTDSEDGSPAPIVIGTAVLKPETGLVLNVTRFCGDDEVEDEPTEAVVADAEPDDAVDWPCGFFVGLPAGWEWKWDDLSLCLPINPSPADGEIEEAAPDSLGVDDVEAEVEDARRSYRLALEPDRYLNRYCAEIVHDFHEFDEALGEGRLVGYSWIYIARGENSDPAEAGNCYWPDMYSASWIVLDDVVYELPWHRENTCLDSADCWIELRQTIISDTERVARDLLLGG